jgi:hypothetical protein
MLCVRHKPSCVVGLGRSCKKWYATITTAPGQTNLIPLSNTISLTLLEESLEVRNSIDAVDEAIIPQLLACEIIPYASPSTNCSITMPAAVSGITKEGVEWIRAYPGILKVLIVFRGYGEEIVALWWVMIVCRREALVPILVCLCKRYFANP